MTRITSSHQGVTDFFFASPFNTDCISAASFDSLLCQEMSNFCEEGTKRKTASLGREQPRRCHYSNPKLCISYDIISEIMLAAQLLLELNLTWWT